MRELTSAQVEALVQRAVMQVQESKSPTLWFRNRLYLVGAYVVLVVLVALPVRLVTTAFTTAFSWVKEEFTLTEAGFEKYFEVNRGDVTQMEASVQAAVSHKLEEKGRKCAKAQLEDLGAAQNCWRLYGEKRCPMIWRSGWSCGALERGEWLAKGYGYIIPVRSVYGFRI